MHNERYNLHIEKYGFEVSATKALSNGTITEADLQLIRDYIAFNEGFNGVGTVRSNTVGLTLISVRRIYGKPFASLTINEIARIKGLLSRAKSDRGTPLKQNTQMSYLKCLKAFARYLITEKHMMSIGQESDLRKIKNIPVDYKTETADDLLTPDDIATMVRASTKARDKALVYTLYETGARASEFCRLTWADLTIQPGMIKVKIDDEKTGQERIAYVIKGFEYLSQLKNEAGASKDFVFKIKDQEMTYRSLHEIVKYIAKRAGITKRVHPHLFRKSIISYMVDQGYSDGLIREMFWGNQDTKQYKTYVKKAAKATEKEMMIKAGLTAPEQEQARPRCICGEIHGPEVLFCPKTGAPQNKQAVAVDSDIMATILSLKAEIAELKKAKGQ